MEGWSFARFGRHAASWFPILHVATLAKATRTFQFGQASDAPTTYFSKTCDLLPISGKQFEDRESNFQQYPTLKMRFAFFPFTFLIL
jgi:hypothetical protein